METVYRYGEAVRYRVPFLISTQSRDCIDNIAVDGLSTTTVAIDCVNSNRRFEYFWWSLPPSKLLFINMS